MATIDLKDFNSLASAAEDDYVLMVQADGLNGKMSLADFKAYAPKGDSGEDAVVYAVEPSALTYKAGTGAVAVNVRKTVGGSTSLLTELPTGWTLYVSATGDGGDLITTTDTLPASISTSGYTKIEVSLYDGNPIGATTAPTCYAAATLLQVSDGAKGDKGDTGAAGAAAVQYRIVPLVNPFPKSGDSFSGIFAVYMYSGDGTMTELDETGAELSGFTFTVSGADSGDGDYSFDDGDYSGQGMSGLGTPVKVVLRDSDQQLVDIAWLNNA